MGTESVDWLINKMNEKISYIIVYDLLDSLNTNGNEFGRLQIFLKKNLSMRVAINLPPSHKPYIYQHIRLPTNKKEIISLQIQRRWPLYSFQFSWLYQYSLHPFSETQTLIQNLASARI